MSNRLLVLKKIQTKKLLTIHHIKNTYKTSFLHTVYLPIKIFKLNYYFKLCKVSKSIKKYQKLIQQQQQKLIV